MILLELVAVAGGTVHTQVPGEEPRPATLLVEDGLVRDVLEPGAELPEDVDRIVDVAGRHVVPGLVDGLVYFDPEHDALYVASGVTLVRDVGSDPARALAQRAPDARERVPGPSVLTAGALLDGDPPAAAEALVLRDPEQVADALAPLVDAEVDFLSVQPNLGEPSWRAVLAVAEEAGLDVWGHVPEGVTLPEALEAGHDGVFYLDALVPEEAEWAFVLPIAFRANVEALVEEGAGIVPLLSGLHARLARSEVGAEQAEADALFLEHMSPFYEAWWRADLARRQAVDEETLRIGRRVRGKQIEVLGMLHEAGAAIVPGSSAPHPWFHPGAGLHAELALWEEAGIPPADVLRHATRGAAEALGVADRHGSLAPGLSADFVVVDEDPREGVATLRDPAWVGVRGRVLDAADLADLLATLRIEQRRARDEVSEPLDIPPPPMPEGPVVLEGQVESGTGGVRVGGERYAVVREPEGTIAYCGRVVSPGTSVVPASETSIVQRVREGRLESFELRVSQGDHELLVEGLSVAGRMNVRRTFDGTQGKPMATLERIQAVSVGSVTALLMLARLGPVEADDPPYAVLHFHGGTEPEVVPWALSLDPTGVFVVGTLEGQPSHGFLLAENGAIEIWEQQLGQTSIIAVGVEADDLGGAGHPLPRELAEEVAERRAASAAAARAREEKGGGKAAQEAGAEPPEPRPQQEPEEQEEREVPEQPEQPEPPAPTDPPRPQDGGR